MPFFNRPDCKKPLTTEEVYKEMVAQRLAQVGNSLPTLKIYYNGAQLGKKIVKSFHFRGFVSNQIML